MKLKHFITALLLIVAVNFTPIIAHAQDGSGIGDPDGPTDVPFDGGVSMLIAAGVAYGIKKKYDHNKQQTKEESNGI